VLFVPAITHIPLFFFFFFIFFFGSPGFADPPPKAMWRLRTPQGFTVPGPPLGVFGHPRSDIFSGSPTARDPFLPPYPPFGPLPQKIFFNSPVFFRWFPHRHSVFPSLFPAPSVPKPTVVHLPGELPPPPPVTGGPSSFSPHFCFFSNGPKAPRKPFFMAFC